MATIRIRDCKIADIKKITKRLIREYQGEDNIANIEMAIKTATDLKTKQIIDSYNINYCKKIIANHIKGNIFELIKQCNLQTIDLTNESRFYKQLIYPYIYEIVYIKIKNSFYYDKHVAKSMKYCPSVWIRLILGSFILLNAIIIFHII
jgi:hypothetical protein